MNHILSAANSKTIIERVEEPLEWSHIGEFFAGKKQWIIENQFEILVAVAIGTLIYFALVFLCKYAKSYAARLDDPLRFRAIIGRTVGKTGYVFILILAIRLVTGFANTPSGIERIISFLFIIIAAYQVAVWARELILGFVERRASEGEDHSSETLVNAMAIIRLIVTISLFAIASIVVLDNLGVDVTGLIAGLGIGGIAIGLAAQGIFSDLFAALAIIFDKPFKRGEMIQYDDTIATVEKTGLKSTWLRSVTGEKIVISNTNLLDKEIINYTRLEHRRTRFKIGVIYQTSPEKARNIPQILKEIVEANNAKFIRAGFISFGDSSIDFELDFDIVSDDFEVVFEGRHIIGLEILQKFNELGYEFAYPTQTTFTAGPDGAMVLPYPEGGYGTRD
ncbi:mechanosensitive ion channel family protein [Sphingorhabdus sp. Alg239-R122]|uniref:mechanosensitive ion channel family protein n=1 Tax=Sphingorhabdus sp. Alg239-R122 TaxID=2305989 RepID=UPI0013DD7257|nr:mechanosensitive ion channel family protein [Sphingorhabdus sp. Alg239-R122]